MERFRVRREKPEEDRIYIFSCTRARDDHEGRPAHSQGRLFIRANPLHKDFVKCSLYSPPVIVVIILYRNASEIFHQVSFRKFRCVEPASSFACRKTALSDFQSRKIIFTERVSYLLTLEKDLFGNLYDDLKLSSLESYF